MYFRLLLVLSITRGQTVMCEQSKPSAAEVYEFGGLLSGVATLDEFETKSNKYFSSKISIKGATKSFQSKSDTLRCTFDDFSTYLSFSLSDCVNKANDYILSSGLCDRQEFTNELENVIQRIGCFFCVLGGRNTGKSFVLKDIAAKFADRILVVDMRKHLDIFSGLVHALMQSQAFWREKITKYVIQKCSPSLARAISKAMKFDKSVTAETINHPASETVTSLFSSFIDLIHKTPVDNQLSLLINILIAANPGLTIIIDEANLALAVDTKNDESRNNLALFTAITKQDNKVTKGF